MTATSIAASPRTLDRELFLHPDQLLRNGILKLLAIKDSDIRILTLGQSRDAVDHGLHSGGAFSATIPLVALFYGGFLRLNIEDPTKHGQDMFTLSKGHAVAALASIEVIEEEGLLAHAEKLGEIALARMQRFRTEHKIVGDVRAKGCLMGIELVKDRSTKEPFDQAGAMIYQKAFRKGLAWIPAGHILRMSPPIVMDEETLIKGLDIIDEAIGETAKELGYGR